MRNSKRLLSLLLALMMVFLVACGSKTSNNGGGESKGEDTKKEESKEESKGEAKEGSAITEYTFAGSNSLQTMDYVVTNKQPDGAWNANFVDGLLEHDNLGKLKGALAESWEVSKDGLTWTFKLRPGVKWVTNTGLEYAEVTAEDFVTGLRHAAEFKSEAGWVVSGIIKGFAEYTKSDFSDAEWEKVGVKALDASTVQYTLEAPAPFFGDIATYSILLPINRQFLESQGEGAKLGKPDPQKSTFGKLSPDSILYNGGYVLSSVDEKSSIVIVKNEAYWDAKNVHLQKVTEIYDDGSDPYSVKNGFENGTYQAMSMKPTWEDYKDIRAKYEQYVRPNLPNATTFGVIFNFNRQTFNHTQYAQDEAAKENTKKAMQNENFRKAFRAAYDVLPELEIDSPTELAKEARRNINNFAEAGFHSDGRNYHQLVQDAYNEKTGEKRNLLDGNSAFYSKEEAMKYIEAAKAEGITFPVHVDMLVLETSDRLVKKAHSMKKSIEEGSNGNIIIGLNLVDKDTINNIAFTNTDPTQADFDINTFAGWGPDYNDPKSYIDTWSPITGTYMVNSGLGNGEENKELKEKLGLYEYQKYYDEANAITDNLDKRYSTFAKADALLLEKALYLPTTMQARGELISKAEPFVANFSEVGLSANKYKNVKFRSELVTAEEYFKAKEAWEAARKEAAGKQ